MTLSKFKDEGEIKILKNTLIELMENETEQATEDGAKYTDSAALFSTTKTDCFRQTALSMQSNFYKSLQHLQMKFG